MIVRMSEHNPIVLISHCSLEQVPMGLEDTIRVWAVHLYKPLDEIMSGPSLRKRMGSMGVRDGKCCAHHHHHHH